MSGLVLDCSVAVSWCFEDEASPETDAILERVRDDGARVPALWHLELGNVLIQAERRKRLTATDTATRLALMAALPILTDDETPARAFIEVMTLARADGLTTHDAAYLELAMRKGLPLASRDRALGTPPGGGGSRSCRTACDRVSKKVNRLCPPKAEQAVYYKNRPPCPRAAIRIPYTRLIRQLMEREVSRNREPQR